MEEKFYELSQDTINDFNNIVRSKTIPTEVRFQFIGSVKQKSLIKITKINEMNSFLLGGKDILVTINEGMYDSFDDESINILFEQEIDKISVKLDTGKISLAKPDLTTFSSLIDKHGIDKISRANQVNVITAEQTQDANDEFIV